MSGLIFLGRLIWRQVDIIVVLKLVAGNRVRMPVIKLEA